MITMTRPLDAEKTTAENLRDRGYAHRHILGDLYRREIYHAQTGVVVARMTCFEANDWMRAGCPPVVLS
jgi:hypothetical protein